MTRKLLVLTLAAACIAGLAIYRMRTSPAKTVSGVVPRSRPDENRFCFDFTNTLPHEIVNRIDRSYARHVRDEFDVDFVIVIVPSLGDKTIEEYADGLLNEWKIGAATGGAKGILVLVARREQRVRIEIGYDLERIYTDAYVGQIERDLLKEFFEQAVWDIGFLSLIEHFTARVETARAGGDDVREVTGGHIGGHYSGGAGARTAFDFGAALDKEIPKLPRELQAYFSAQPTPLRAFQRYMEHSARAIKDRQTSLFSESTKEFYRHWPRGTTRQQHAEARGYDGLPVFSVIDKQNKYAVVMREHGNDPDKVIGKNPYFFVRSEEGWQVDLGVMAHSIVMFNSTGGWHFMCFDHPYMFAFEEYVMGTDLYYPREGQKAFLGLCYKDWNKQWGGYEVVPEYHGPAHRAGLARKEAGKPFTPDILISIDGIRITKKDQDWFELMHDYRPGDKVKLKIVRNEKRKSVTAILDEAVPFGERDTPGGPWLGLYLAGSMPYERKAAGSYFINYVVEAIPGSPAERAGIMTGDVIIRPGRESVRKLLARKQPGDTITIRVLRDLKNKRDIVVNVGSRAPDARGL